MAEPGSLWNGITAAFIGIVFSIILLLIFGFAGLLVTMPILALIALTIWAIHAYSITRR